MAAAAGAGAGGATIAALQNGERCDTLQPDVALQVPLRLIAID